MLKEVKRIMVCPKCSCKEFVTTATIQQDWKVDEDGNFIEVVEECTQTLYGPDHGNIWTCVKCGAEAVEARVVI